jgi:hypothetical protein
MAGEISKTSVEDIAKTLLQMPVEDVVEDDSPVEGSEVDDLTTDETADEAGQDQETTEVEEVPYEGESETEDEADDEAEVGEEAQTYVDIRDDDEIEVMIDGQLETRTIADLKKAVSGEGAIEKRLQEATEARKTAHAERTTMLEALAEQERLVANSFAALDETVFKAVIPPPNPKMKDTNPAAYLRHKEAYDEDQKRISDAKRAVQSKVQELAAQRQVRLKEYGDAAAQQIAKIIPELVDPKQSPIMLEKLVNTAKQYGYTEQEISAALDPRMFHLVRDALRYRELTSRAKETRVTDLSKQGQKPVARKLRSGNTKAATMVATRAKEQAKVKAMAAQTGKVSDVAKTLLRPKGT